MEKQELKLCLIGAGYHSSINIYPCLHHLENVRVVANADLDLDKARRIAAPFAIPMSYSDYREMLDKEEPDAVIICVNDEFHAKGAIDVMERGIDVYTEKPPAPSFAVMRQVVETKRKAGKICMTGYKKRFAPAYAKAKAIIESEDFGHPTLITVLRTRGSLARYLHFWGCHVLDLMPHLFGPVARVCAFRTPRDEDAYSINMAFENGAVGNLSVSNRPVFVWEEVTACGSNSVTVRTQNSIFMQAYKGGQPFAQHWANFSEIGEGHVEQGFVAELVEFVAAIRENREPESSVESSAHSVAIYEASERSVTSGQPEDVETL